MAIAKLFLTGRSQAVRLPKEFRFEGTEVQVKHFGKSGVLLMPTSDPWAMLVASLDMFEPSFVMKREQPEIQVREDLLP